MVFDLVNLKIILTYDIRSGLVTYGMLADEGKYVLAKTQTSEICPEIRSEQRTYIVYLRSPQKMLVNREGENREC